jgi:hypothetical protein
LKKLFIRLLIFCVVVAAVAAIAVGGAVYSFNSLPAPAPMPDPNGYDDIIRAGTAISNRFRAYKTAGANQLRVMLGTNAAAIAQGHAALKLDCRVRLQWPPDSTSSEEAAAPSNLAEAFAAEGLLAETEHRTQDALKDYLDIVRLGNQSSRGGFASDCLRGLAIESRGADLLQKLSVILDAKSCAEVAKALESADSQRERLADYRQQEKILYHQKFPEPKDSFRWYFDQTLHFNANEDIKTQTTDMFRNQRAAIRHAMVGIAVRAYEMDKSTRPRNISFLVPAYLTTVPIDPLTGTNISL